MGLGISSHACGNCWIICQQWVVVYLVLGFFNTVSLAQKFIPYPGRMKEGNVRLVVIQMHNVILTLFVFNLLTRRLLRHGSDMALRKLRVQTSPNLSTVDCCSWNCSVSQNDFSQGLRVRLQAGGNSCLASHRCAYTLSSNRYLWSCGWQDGLLTKVGKSSLPSVAAQTPAQATSHLPAKDCELPVGRSRHPCCFFISLSENYSLYWALYDKTQLQHRRSSQDRTLLSMEKKSAENCLLVSLKIRRHLH